ncbi:MAG: hypothetical protein K5771_01690 [Oscillospiraceae bacterium]|nr:hypothetical protein [Oscillospiraceae bacterium]
MARKNVKFELNLKGLNELMKSPAMKSVEMEAAQSIVGQLGPGYTVEPPKNMSFVAITTVHASDPKAFQDCRENDVLRKAADSTKI